MNNKPTAARHIRVFAISWLAAMALLVASLVWRDNTPLITQLILAAAVVGIALIFGLGCFYYLEISSDKEAFTIKYFNLFPMGREYKAMRLPFSRYRKHEVSTKWGGLFHYLSLYEETGHGVARYPALGLTALSAAEREEIIRFFKKMEK